MSRSTSPVLTVTPELKRFVEEEVIPELSLTQNAVWQGLEQVLSMFIARNESLLEKRTELQDAINRFHTDHKSDALEPEKQHEFLVSIGYLVPTPPPFQIETQNVDAELAKLSGPQLVVPVDNARYALNAANARWGSLYDALYGTDAMGSLPMPGPYDQSRGDAVIAWAKSYLDEIFPLKQGSHMDVSEYVVKDGTLLTSHGELTDPQAFRGYRGDPLAPDAILLCKNGLHLEICIDPASEIGSKDTAGVSDILVEAAISAIMDFEDSVAAVDAADKTSVYRNWLGLMRGTLTCEFSKEGKTFTRKLTEDRTYTAHDGQPLTLKGRALMLVRNVGHLMKTPIVLYNGQEVPEGIVDAYITALIGLHDIENGNVNSQTGSVYIVKPKMHGPSEAAFAVDLFSACEQIIGLPQNTLKIGVMDEERRTSLNLAAVLYEVKQRVVFTNTGFLDRTGDEIHTAMRLGPVMRKQDMKSATWLQAYENNNVDVSLKSGFSGRGQIGKGMWTMPDLMRDMLDAKIAHPMSGANTAWVPSPTAATLHALHYHRVSVVKRQTQLRGRETDMRDLLTPPITEQPNWSTEEINAELENNLQGILGYIVRWIELGVGCSKVPDIDEVALMEDRATCRISSQILSNWLHWSIVDEAMLRSVAERMAAKVDQQNSKTKGYHPIAGHAAGHPVVDAAIALIKQGIDGPSGYTEPILHAARLAHKKADGE